MTAIEANVTSVRTRLEAISGVDFSFTPASIQWLDGYIERVRHAAPDKQALAQPIGSYFGETLRRVYGGKWVDSDGQPAIEIEPGLVVFPFNKVRKQLKNGSEDSIQSMFTSTAVMLAEHRKKPRPAPR